MEIDRTSDRPVYKQVADALRGAIRSGELRDGERLPSETELTARYGVSRNSVRTAIGLLRLEGLVATEHGRGSFVRVRRLLRRLSSSSYPTVCQTGSADADEQLLRIEVVRPPDEVADRLGLPARQHAVVRRHVLMLGGEPVAFADRYVPLNSVEPTRPERRVDEVTLRMPSPEEMRRLRMSEGVPVVRVLRTHYDCSGAAVQVSDLLLVGDRHVLVYEMPAH
ncbi:MAG: GntR family transcriptional regulator [Egibacteraceae bacterium]